MDPGRSKSVVAKLSPLILESALVNIPSAESCLESSLGLPLFLSPLASLEVVLLPPALVLRFSVPNSARPRL